MLFFSTFWQFYLFDWTDSKCNPSYKQYYSYFEVKYDLGNIIDEDDL